MCPAQNDVAGKKFLREYTVHTEEEGSVEVVTPPQDIHMIMRQEARAPYHHVMRGAGRQRGGRDRGGGIHKVCMKNVGSF